MHSASLRAALARALILVFLTVVGILLFSSSERILTVRTQEAAADPAAAEAAKEWIEDIGKYGDGMRESLTQALSHPALLPYELRGTETELRRGVWTFAHERIEAMENLAALLCLRLASLMQSLAVLLVLTAAVVTDAGVMRRIANEGFETARPAVSFLSMTGFVTALAFSAILMMVPVSGAGAAGLVLMTVSLVGLHGWVRWFHVL